jgi:hypothetical protein
MQPLPSAPLAAKAVARQFASRPTLASVVQTLLSGAIRERYPSLTIDLSLTHLAIPLATKGWKFQSLMDVVLQYLGSDGPLDFRDRHDLFYYLSDELPKRLTLAGASQEKLDMTVIEGLIRDLPSTLPIALQDAVAEYWNQDADSGLSRWQWLSDMLLSTLRAGTLRQADLDEFSRQTLDQLIGTPDREQRVARYGDNAVFAYGLMTQIDNAGQTTRLLSEHLLLTRTINGTAPVLLCTPSGRVEHFVSMDAFTQAWGQRLGAQYQAQALTCNRYEPEGSIFDHQAASIFNLQMENLGALTLPLDQSPQTLETLYQELTDPGLYFLDAQDGPIHLLDAVRTRLPEPLRNATAENRDRYRHYSLALAAAKKQAGGRTFLSGIDDLHAFTVRALQHAMEHEASAAGDTPLQPPLHPDDVELTFVVAAGYPGTAGIVERVRMSLTELAIKNLAGQPSGTMSVAHRLGTPLPAWLTAAYINGSAGLIQRVNIGKQYPLLLKQQLLGDTPRARERETLFAAQQPLQLPLQALELHLKGESGISQRGAQMVAALMQVDRADQQVDNKPVMIRHLSLSRSPDASADVVSNMYLIEFQDLTHGPHLLYRPLYSQPLREFASRAALFNAIAQPGELQTSVLTWLPDIARPIYDHGGFHEPHYLRFGQGDEFASRRTPAPATLSTDGVNDELHQCLVTGRLMSYLFSDNGRALVEQAERESTSNSESRWQVLMEGSSLLFGGLLQPLLRGPSMIVGWLLILFGNLSRDIQQLDSQSPEALEQGAIDLLLTVATALLDSPATLASRPKLASTIRQKALRPPARRRNSDQWPAPPPPLIRQGTVSLPGEPPQGSHTALDFSFAQARYRLTPSQRANLATFKVPLPAELPRPVLNGPRKGLYVIDNHWHARVNGDLFRIDLEEAFNVRIVDPADTTRLGPYLRGNEQGVWSIDMRLRLLGGMPPKRIAAERERKARRIKELTDDFQQLFSSQEQVQQGIDAAEAAQDAPNLTTRQKADARKHYDATLKAQTDGFQKILDSLKERDELRAPLPPKTVLTLLENAIKNARKHVLCAEDDRTELYRRYQAFTIDGPELHRAVLSNPQAYRQFIEQVIEINDRSMHWLDLKDRYLEHLYGLGSAGRTAFNRMMEGRPNELNSLALKDLQIRSVKRLIVKDFKHPLFQAFNTVVTPLHEHVRTHAELNNLELTASERLSVLESLEEHYGRALDALQGLAIVDADVLDPVYNTKLLTIIEALYQNVNQRLSREVKPVAHTSSQPPKQPQVVAGRPTKRVIKTRRKGTLIGELHPIGNVEVVEVRDETNNKVLSSYSQQGDVWVEYVVQAPVPAAAAPRALSLVKGEARKLLAMLQEHVRRGEHYKSISRHPLEVQEVLDYEATRYDKLATELEQAIQVQPESARTAADQALVNDMRQAGARLNTLGASLRTQLCLDLPPTHANLEYLLDRRQVNVARLGARIQLSGDRRDFIQEYAINDPKGKPVWYAHFHYPAVDTPNADYTAAHLKTREQRKQSYYSLLAKAESSQAVVDVHRGMIGKALAQRWFLSFGE